LGIRGRMACNQTDFNRRDRGVEFKAMTEKEIVIRNRRNQRFGLLILAIAAPLILIGMVVFMKTLL